MPELTMELDPSKALKTQQLHALLAAVVRTVSNVCSASDECATRLDQIEEQMEETSGLEGVRVLRYRLEECLQTLRNETRREREELSQTLARLQKQVAAAQAGDGEDALSSPEIDKVSGLEMRESAERAMAMAVERGGVAYAALFVVDRLHLINAQFGYATGDRILREFCEHLRSSLLPEDQLFRWTGPAFLAVIRRSEAPTEVEADVQRIAGGQLEAAVQIGNGCVRLPIVRNSLLLPLPEGSTLADLSRRLDAFTGQQARH
jgi:GGDEF domain-containing protein